MPPISIFRRNTSSPETAAMNEEAFTSSEVALPMSPEEFLKKHKSSLQASRDAWGGIHAYVAVYRSEEIVAGLQEGVANNFKASNMEATSEDCSLVAQNMAEDLSAMWLLAARYEAAQLEDAPRGVFSLSRLAMKYVNAMPSQAVRHCVTNMGRLAQASIGKNFLEMSFKIEEADKQSKFVLEQFANEGLNNTENARLYRDSLLSSLKNDTPNPDAKELRHMIAVDWHNPNTSNSSLRQYFSQLRMQPDSLVIPFIEKVVHDPSNRELETIRRMAGFAIIAQNREPSEDTLGGVLLATRGSWQKEDFLSRAFERFVEGEIGELQRLVAEIAGRPDPKDIRMHRQPETIQQLFNMIEQRGFANRATRREVKRRTGQALHFDSKDLPFTKDIDQQLIEAAKPANRQLRLVRQGVHNEINIEPIEMDNLVDHYIKNSYPGREKDSQLAKDIATVIKHLQDTPNFISGGFTRLTKGTHNIIKVGKKDVKLWRFAPDKAPGVRVSAANRFMRVVCGFENGSLLLVDVMPHDEFDKKY